MAKRDSSWNPLDAGVTVEQDNVSKRILISHPANPYARDWDEEHDGAAGLFAIANDYVALLENPDDEHDPLLGLSPEWLKDLRASPQSDDARLYLFWLPLNPGGAGDPKRDPRNSFWVERYSEPSKPSPKNRLDRTAVLLACLFESPDRKFPLMGGQGLRLTMHVGAPVAGKARVRVTGITSTLPSGFERAPLLGFAIDARSIRTLSTQMLKTFGLAGRYELASVGIRIEPPAAARRNPRTRAIADAVVLANAIPQKDARADSLPYLLVARRTGAGALLPVAKQAVVAANVQAPVFDQDPMTQRGPAFFHALRPQRVPPPFDALRVVRNFPNCPASGAGKSLLDDGTVIVTNSLLVDIRNGAPSEDSAKEVPAVVNATTRTNESAAVNAYYHASELFARLARYGIVASAYFKFVLPRLMVRYRSGIIPGPGKDGNVVNAQVLPLQKPVPAFDGELLATNAKEARVELRLALADLRLSPRRSPLGIACAPRWMWHEFCHVLLVAATGEIELRFAHSAGDAMAAILFDPLSQLAPDPNWRGVTFPWVSLPARRHDRPVGLGWGWSGSLYQRDRFYVTPGLCDKRGYWAEQILSSSLFRLYRAIGGDAEAQIATADPAARAAAAEHAVFLIVQAIGALSAAPAVPAYTARDFVDAMIAADVGTGQFGAGAAARFGGMVSKVIRWAFQQQGLYHPTGNPFPVNQPGPPGDVDLHIDSQRNPADGTYAPVNFRDTAWQAASAALWIRHNDDAGQADQAPRANQKNHIFVEVRNLGGVKAENVAVSVLWAPLTNTGAVPAFDGTWQAIGPRLGSIPRRGKKKFGPFKWTPAAGNFAVMAVATCPSDRANIDPASGFPCAQPGLALNTAQLVAWDNNLGLRIFSPA